MNMNTDYASAHVIVVSNYGFDDNKIPKQYVLFGLTKKGELSSFGGQREKLEKNPKDTAAREATEESLGLLGNHQEIRKMLRGVDPVSGKQSGHPHYILPGKYYGDDVIGKFKELRFDKSKKLSFAQKEMVDLVAIRVEDIRNKVNNGEKLIFPDNNKQNCSVRDFVGDALIAAVKNGKL